MSAKQTVQRRGSRAQRKLRSPAPNGLRDFSRLPSGRTLAEFALASGFLAPPLMSNGGRAGERKAS